MIRKASLAFAFALIAAACSSSNNGTTGTTTTGAAATTVGSSGTTAAAATTGAATTTTVAAASTGATTAAASTSGTTGEAATTAAATTGSVTTVGATTGATTGTITTATTGSGTTGGATTGSTTSGSSGPVFPIVFNGQYAQNVSYLPYGSSVGTPTIDTTTLYNGLPTLSVTVPTPATAAYIGGALVNSTPQDLSSYNALTFWAKASVATTLSNVELGNDAATTTYQAQWNGAALTTTWTQYYIPIPVAGDATSIDGLFGFAQSPQATAATIWFADIEYATVTTGATGVISAPSPAIATETAAHVVGDTFATDGLSITYTINGATETITPVGGVYFTFSSSDTSVATVADDGTITAVGVGTAVITAALDGVASAGAITVNVSAKVAPTTAAPTPTLPQTSVLSLLSSAYTPIPLTDLGATWSNNNAGPNLTSSTIAGSITNEYASLAYVGLEFTTTDALDLVADGITALHVDMWTATGTTWGIEVVDFGGAVGTGTAETSQGQVNFTTTSTPAVTTGTWISFDIPLTSFETAGLTTTPHDVQQVLLVGDGSNYYVENIYFHK